MEIYDKIFGLDHKEKSELLDKELLEIQEKHSNWFDQNLGNFEDGCQKTIIDCRVIIISENGQLFFKLLEDLPDYIEKECYSAYNSIF